MKITTASLVILGFVLPLISAQLTYYENRYPPAPATRRLNVRNGQLIGRRSAAIQQAHIDEIDEPEPTIRVPQEPQELEEPHDLGEPIEQVQVPTQRPLRNGNGLSQPPVPSRSGNGFPRPTTSNGFSRIPQQPVYGGVGQTVDRDEGSDEQQQDSGLTDAPQDDVSTENLVPGVVTSSDEVSTDDGFTPTEPLTRPLLANGRKTSGNGQKPVNGNGKKAVNGNSPKIVNGNGQKPINGKGQTPGDEDHHKSGGDDHHDHHSGDPIQWLRDAISGEPGADYPIFFTPPETAFKCTEQQWPGYYADVEARCQVFHICQSNGRSDAFLCPNGTIFSQQNFVCVWWYDFDCATAPQFYELNSQLYVTPEKGQSQEPSADIGGKTDERTTTSTGDSTGDSVEGQEPVSPNFTEQSPLPSLPSVSDDSKEVVSDETPAEEVPTTTLNGLRGTGRQRNGVKGGQNGYKNGSERKSGRTNGKSDGLDGISLKVNGNGNGKRVNGNGAKPSNGGSRIGKTNKPVNGSGSKKGKKNGNGAQVIPDSPAITGRKPNGRVNGNGQQRTNGGNKSIYRPTVQRAELDEEASNVYYRGR